MPASLNPAQVGGVVNIEPQCFKLILKSLRQIMVRLRVVHVFWRLLFFQKARPVALGLGVRVEFIGGPTVNLVQQLSGISVLLLCLKPPKKLRSLFGCHTGDGVFLPRLIRETRKTARFCGTIVALARKPLATS